MSLRRPSRPVRRRKLPPLKPRKLTWKEHLTKDTIKGKLLRIKGEYFIIKDDDGKEHEFRVDKSTQRDLVKPGDMVKPM